MKKARYICIEGIEGVGKTTQTQRLVDHLRGKGFKVLQTKEPGTPLSPLTIKLRAIMLDNQYDKELTRQARELISQAIRSIHLEHVIYPALESYDYIVQDRGFLSGYAYGIACGNSIDEIHNLQLYIGVDNIKDLYDDVVILMGNVSNGLERALTSKKEFVAGDAMETRGSSFLNAVNVGMMELSSHINSKIVTVDDKNIDEVFCNILDALKIER